MLSNPVLILVKVVFKASTLAVKVVRSLLAVVARGYTPKLLVELPTVGPSAVYLTL